MSDDMELNFKGKIYDEHKDWPTLEKKVAAAFQALQQEDLYTSTEITGSGGDGEAEIRDNLDLEQDEEGRYVGYAYYNAFDKKEGRAFAELPINFGSYTDADTWEQDPKEQQAVGRKVVAALRAQGLKCEDPEEGYNSLVVSL